MVSKKKLLPSIGGKKAVVVDPSIRIEDNLTQAENVHLEKCRICEPTIPFLMNKINVDNITVIGLCFESREPKQRKVY